MNLIDDYFWMIKRGEVGAIRRGTLSDEDGPVTLAGTLVVTASREGVVAFALKTCTIDPDQTTNRGKFTYTFDSDTANIPSGLYDLEFKNTNGGVVSIWPLSNDVTKKYAVLLVQDPLA